MTKKVKREEDRALNKNNPISNKRKPRSKNITGYTREVMKWAIGDLNPGSQAFTVMDNFLSVCP